MLSSEVVREKHGRVSSRGDSLKLSVLLFRGNTVGWELSRRKKPRRPWRPATVSSVSQRTSPGKVVKWNPPVSSLTMFPFEYFFLFFLSLSLSLSLLAEFFSPGEGDVSLLFFFIFAFCRRFFFSFFFFFFFRNFESYEFYLLLFQRWIIILFKIKIISNLVCLLLIIKIVIIKCCN